MLPNGDEVKTETNERPNEQTEGQFNLIMPQILIWGHALYGWGSRYPRRDHLYPIVPDHGLFCLQ